MKPTKKPLEGIVFDIDGVLVDTRASYLEAIRITTEQYLVKVLLIRPQGSPLLTIRDVEMFKMLGGFNNDWDCVEGLLIYFLSRLKRFDRASLQKINLSDLKRLKNIPKLLRSKDRSFLKCERSKRLIFYPKIVQIFQEVYLGKDVYRNTYGKDPLFWNNKGLYLKERLILPRSFFGSLKMRGLKLGIATGRIRSEANMVLDRFKLKPYFSSIVTADDIGPKKAKPHPYSLIENAKRLGIKRLAYIGDIPDDMLAARRADSARLRVLGIGLLEGVREKETMRKELFRLHADYVAKNRDVLEALIRKLT